MFATVSVIVMLLAGPTPAAPAKGSKLEQGQKQFASGEIDTALKTLDAAALETTDGPTLEKVHLLRAQCFAARQDFVKTEEAFGLALDANPEATLDPTRVDPTLVKLLESVRARSQGSVVVNSTPTGATFSVDGKAMGLAPQTVQLPAGKHKLEARWAEGPTNEGTGAELKLGPVQTIEVLVRPRRETRVEWVQQEVAGHGPGELTPRAIRPFGDLRGVFEPSTSGAVDGGLQLGGGIELSYFRLGLFVRLFPTMDLTPRFQFSLPVYAASFGDFHVALEVGAPFTFLPDGLGIGFQGAGGVELYPVKWLGAYVYIGGRHHFLWPGRNDVTAFTATGGLRLRMP
ncbi:MAG: PEGA domain-containing protein [Archangium sp.]|nr:PEGA domain-containing protein [Archangium sp.]